MIVFVGTITMRVDGKEVGIYKVSESSTPPVPEQASGLGTCECSLSLALDPEVVRNLRAVFAGTTSGSRASLEDERRFSLIDPEPNRKKAQWKTERQRYARK